MRSTLILITLFLCGFLLRGAWLLNEQGIQISDEGKQLFNDEAEYDALARGILAGNGYNQNLTKQGAHQIQEVGKPTAFRTPGFPIILGVIYWVFGDGHSLARVVLTTVSSFIAPLLYLLCLTIFNRQAVALLAAASWVVLPTSIRLSGWLYGEEMAALLIVLALLITVYGERKRSWIFICLAGIFLGFAILTRGFLLLIPLGPAVWLVTRKAKWLAVGLILSAAILPSIWVIRNTLALGIITLSTQTPEVQWLGSNSWARGSWPGDWSPQHNHLLQKYPDFDHLDEAGRYHVFAREAIYEVTEHPRRILWLLPRKVLLFFNPKSWLGMDWVFGLSLPFFVLGSLFLWFKREYRDLIWLLILPLVGTLLINLMTFSDVRFRHPIDPLILMLASFGLIQFVSRFSSSWVRRYKSVHSGEAEQTV